MSSKQSKGSSIAPGEILVEAEVQRRLNVGAGTLREARREGRLKATTLGRTVCYLAEDLHAWVLLERESDAP